MPHVTANGITMHYEQQGSGDPLVLIPYLAADHACYAFQVPEYAKHFTCITVDLRGTGESDKPDVPYTTQTLADDVAAFIQALGISRAHVGGMSLGAAVAMWLAAAYPERVLSLSLHAGWTKTDPLVKTVVQSWQVMANALGSVPETTILGIFPWCFTPELYAARPEFIQMLADFVRSRPAQPVQAFMRQSNAVIAHDVEARLPGIAAPTLATFGGRDLLVSTRFVDPIKAGIRNCDTLVFDRCSHAALYESVEEFNQKTLQFLLRHGRTATV